MPGCWCVCGLERRQRRQCVGDRLQGEVDVVGAAGAQDACSRRPCPGRPAVGEGGLADAHLADDLDDDGRTARAGEGGVELHQLTLASDEAPLDMVRRDGGQRSSGEHLAVQGGGLGARVDAEVLGEPRAHRRVLRQRRGRAADGDVGGHHDSQGGFVVGIVLESLAAVAQGFARQPGSECATSCDRARFGNGVGGRHTHRVEPLARRRRRRAPRRATSASAASAADRAAATSPFAWRAAASRVRASSSWRSNESARSR